MATSWRQDKFAFRNDDGSETTATYTSGCANYTIPIYGDRNIRIRLAVTEQGTTSATLTPWLWIQKNGAGGYYSASACSGSGIYPYASSNFSDGDATTVQINPVTFVAGTMDEVDGKCAATGTIVRYSGTEAEYNLHISASTIADGAYFDFRAYNQTTALNTYSLTGRLTISKWAGINDATEAQTVDNATITYYPPTFSLTAQDDNQAQTVENATITAHDPVPLLSIQDTNQTETVENTTLTYHAPTFSLTAQDDNQEQTVENCTITYHGPSYSLTFQDANQAQDVENTIITYHEPTEELPLRDDGSRYYHNYSGTRMYWDSIHNLSGHDISISIWFDMTSMSDWETYLLNVSRDDNSSGLTISIPTSRAVKVLRRSTVGNLTVLGSTADIIPDNWINIIITSVGNGVATDTHIYVNGEEASYSTQTSYEGTEVSLGGKWVAGYEYYLDSSSGLYYGWLGELAVWTRIIDSDEIAGLSDWGEPKSAMNYDTDLVFCFHPDEPTDLVTDTSPTTANTDLAEGPDLEFPEAPIEPVTLTIQDDNQTQTVENAVITYHEPSYSITIQDGAQAQTVENAVITYHPYYALTISDTSQLHTSEKATLTYYPYFALSVNDTSHLQTADGVTITGHIPNFTLTAQDAYQLQIVDNVVIIIPVTAWVLEVQDAIQLHYADNATYEAPAEPLADIFVGKITYPTIVKTLAQVQITKPVIVTKKAY
jgi:hypothetical protein